MVRLGLGLGVGVGDGIEARVLLRVGMRISARARCARLLGLAHAVQLHVAVEEGRLLARGQWSEARGHCGQWQVVSREP